MSASQLIGVSGLVVEANQVPVYVSRFRTALKRLFTEKKNGLVDYMPGSQEARLCFIVSNRGARGQNVSKDTYYQLALPPDRVKYIAPN